MTMCAACAISEKQPWHQFQADCQGCVARGLARGYAFVEARMLGKVTDRYQDELDMAGVTHQQVKDWAQRDALGRKP